ncbi:MAG: hypothetical protein ACPGVB_09620 [Chitinophagales bacterium]
MDYETVNWSLILMTIVFLLCVFAFFMVSIQKSGKILHNKFIRGTWKYSGTTPTGEPWYYNYQFAENTFSIEAYPTFKAQGNYQIVKEIENLLILKAYNISGDGDTGEHFLNIGVDTKRKQLTINDRIYKWVNEKTE